MYFSHCPGGRRGVRISCWWVTSKPRACWAASGRPAPGGCNQGSLRSACAMQVTFPSQGERYCACKGVRVQQGGRRLRVSAHQESHGGEAPTRSSPAVGIHGPAQPQTGNGAKSEWVTAPSSSKWEREREMRYFHQPCVWASPARTSPLPCLQPRPSHPAEIQIPTTHLIFPHDVLGDLFRSH